MDSGDDIQDAGENSLTQSFPEEISALNFAYSLTQVIKLGLHTQVPQINRFTIFIYFQGSLIFISCEYEFECLSASMYTMCEE